MNKCTGPIEMTTTDYGKPAINAIKAKATIFDLDASLTVLYVKVTRYTCICKWTVFDQTDDGCTKTKVDLTLTKDELQRVWDNDEVMIGKVCAPHDECDYTVCYETSMNNRQVGSKKFKYDGRYHNRMFGDVCVQDWEVVIDRLESQSLFYVDASEGLMAKVYDRWTLKFIKHH